MASKLLLKEDVENVGRSGDIVSVKPGFARNFLIPQGKALIADKYAIRLQKQLQEERQAKALEDKKESEELAKRLEIEEFIIPVKVDADDHLYGSVTTVQIQHMIEERLKVVLNKKAVQLKSPIKKLGSYPVELRLKEDVPAVTTVKVVNEAAPEAESEAE